MLRKGLYFIAVTWFIINLFITCIFTLSFNRNYYDNMYTKLEVAQTIGISEDSLEEATDVLLDYIKGKRDNLDLLVSIDNQDVQMFNQREKDHMVDVKALYNIVNEIRFIGSIFVAIMILLSIGVGDYVNIRLNRNIMRASLIFLGIVVLYLASYALLDFNAFWIQFHELIFTNDLWLLDPRVDRLIMMVPYDFFLGLVTQIVVGIIAIVIGCLGVYLWLNKVVRKNDSRRIV